MQCQECRTEKWPQCPAVPEWFNPSDIQNYCPHQVTWVLENLLLLKSGWWPPEGLDTGYYDTNGQKIRRHGAYYEVPICVASDVELRLEKCGKDGVLTRKCLSEGWDEQTLSELMGKPIWMIREKIEKVVLYCSGNRARVMSYYEFTRRRGISNKRTSR